MRHYQRVTNKLRSFRQIASEPRNEDTHRLGSDHPSSQGTAVSQTTPLFLHPIQAKMALGGVNDKYEQEADEIAETVVGRLHHQNSVLPSMGATTNIQRMPELEETLRCTSTVQCWSDSGIGEMSPEQEM